MNDYDADLMSRAADIINLVAEESKASQVVNGEWKVTHDYQSAIANYIELKALAKALRRRAKGDSTGI
jgi:hypothetical protein